MPGRFAAALGRDLRVQYRARYVGIALAALAVWAAALRFIRPVSGHELAPAFLFLNTFLLSFSLGVSQARCEREDGTLAALDLTPLRPHEFLAARCASLGLLAAVQNPLIPLLAGEPVAGWAALLAGVCAEAAILSLIAFLVGAYLPAGRLTVARLLASLLLLAPPLLPFLGFAPGAWLPAHPLQGPLLLLRGAFSPIPPAAAAPAILLSGFWMACILFMSRMLSKRKPEFRNLPAAAGTRAPSGRE